MNRKVLSILFRVLLAGAGIGYIFWSVDWVDHVAIKPHTAIKGLVDEQGKPRAFAVSMQAEIVRGQIDPRGQHQGLTLALVLPMSDGQVARHEFEISGEELAQHDQYLIRPSILTTLRFADHRLLVVGLLLILPVFPLQTLRWLVLMRARGLPVTTFRAFRLYMIGVFFNFCMPGQTGGDVIKAYYAAARSERRTDAVMSVIFDRIAGTLGLFILASLMGLLIIHDPLARRITMFLWAGLLLLMVGALVYFTPVVRRVLGLDWLLCKLPLAKLLNQIDQAAQAYRHHPQALMYAVLLSIPVHFLLVTATALAGYAFDMQTPLGLLVTVIPVIFIGGAVPITPQGAGVWELLGQALLLNPPMVTMNQIVAMLLMFRLYMLVYALLGSLFLLKGDIHLHPEKSGPVE